MKKILLLLMLAVSVSATQAQFGVKGGLNVANWAGEDVDDEGRKAKIGPYLGVFYNAALSDNFSIQPELVYSAQGVKYELLGESGKISTNYINVTGLLRYNSSGFFVGVGPQFGFLLSAKAKIDGEEEDLKDEMNSTDIAGAFAVGYELESGLGFYARYNHSFTSLDDTEDSKVFNRVFQVGLRYVFSKKKADK